MATTKQSSSKIDELFHCRLQIIRKGSDYDLATGEFSLNMHLFFPRTGAPFFSVGSAVEDYIHLKKLVKQHVCCVLVDDAIIFKAKAPVEILCRGARHNIDCGESVRIPINTTSASFSFVNWQMIFPDQSAICGSINIEKESLSSEAREYLQAQYGEFEKVNQGLSSLIFKTQNLQILKIIRPSFVGKKGVIKRFVNAARKFQTLPSDSFLPIDEIVYRRECSLCYVVGEYFAGETLENHLARKGILPQADAEAIVCKIAEGLAVMQQRGYCCRNLTPDNILLREDGELRISGFFLLKSEDAAITAPGTQMVIPKYTAPEQIKDPSSVDIRTDMFSLGAIFYALLTGQPPFQSSNTKEYKKFVTNATSMTAQEIRDTAPYLSMDSCELLASLLVLDRNERLLPQELIAKLTCNESSDELDDNLLQLLEEKEEELSVDNHSNTLLDSDSDFTQTFVALLNKVDREVKLPATELETHTSIDHILQDVEQELSDADISSLSEVKIISLEKNSTLTDTNKRLREMYEQVDVPEKIVDNKKTGVRKQALASPKQRHFYTLPLLISVLFLVLCVYWGLDSKPQIASSTSKAPAVPSTTKRQPHSIRGKIVRIEQPGQRILYFVVVGGQNREYAVTFPKKFSVDVQKNIHMAKKNDTAVQITGFMRTSKRKLQLRNSHTRKYIKLQKIIFVDTSSE